MRQIKYQETKDILMHKIKPSPLVSEFSEWFYHKYFAKLLNIDLEVIQPSNLELRYSLLIIIENQAGSFKKTDISINHQVEIKEKFAELSVKHNFENINNPNDIVLISLCFFYEKVKSALIQETLDQATIFLKSKYPEILWLERWQDNIAVIYHTDDQSDENEKKGTNKTIMDIYFGFIKKYDELNLFPAPLTGIFVSQETLNRSYSGKLYYYMW